jgi:hypothetical protein
VAATTQIALPARTASPIALWHLLSLDAPTVALLWTWFIARTTHIAIPAAVVAAMALAVWILYAADRLLDTRRLDEPDRAPSGELEARHLFHHAHRRAFLVGIVFAVLGLSTLLPQLDGRAIRLYLVEGALLAVWFLILHATRSAHRLPKEIAVGLFFSAAVFVPTVARAPALRSLLLPAAVLLAAVCSLNCLFIYAWEHEGVRPGTRPPHATTRLALAHLPTMAIVIAISSAVTILAPQSPRPILAACALSAVALLVLDRNRHHVGRTKLRAAADIALLTPLLVLAFLR